jgi:hypothetical protein
MNRFTQARQRALTGSKDEWLKAKATLKVRMLTDPDSPEPLQIPLVQDIEGVQDR